mgnify:CR=1 FL=1
MKSIYLYAFVIWVLFLVLGVINEITREKYYPDFLTDIAKHQISSVVFIFVILLVMYLFFNKFSVAYAKTDLWFIGTLWVLLTICFEFLFGHYVLGKEMSLLFADYNIFNGRLWLVVLLFTFVGPRLVAEV